MSTNSNWRRTAFLMLLPISGTGLLVAGCGSTNNGSVSQSAGGPVAVLPAELGDFSPQATAEVALLQQQVGQVVAGTLAIAKFAAPVATGFRQISPRTFTPELRGGDINGRFIVDRTEQVGGRFKIEIFQNRGGAKGNRVATLISLPTQQQPDGFTQELILGPEVESVFGAGSTFRSAETFFGCEGRALLKYNLDGVLQSVEYNPFRFFGDDLTSIRDLRGEAFQPITGVLTKGPSGTFDGELTYGTRGTFNVKGIQNATGNFQSLSMASSVFGGVGQLLINSNFDASGEFVPVQDIRNRTSSPLVFGLPLAVPPLPPAPAPVNPLPPILTAPLTSGGSVAFVVKDFVFSVTRPDGVTQSVSIFSQTPFAGLEGAQIALPAGSRLVAFASPQSVIPVGGRAAIFVYAQGPDGLAVPFTTNQAQLSTNSSGIVQLVNTQQVRGVAPGTASITYNDNLSGLSASTLITVVAGGGGTSGKGFVYLPDLTNQRIVRFAFNPQSPGEPTNRTNFPTGHSVFRIAISSDQQFLFAENTDQTVQVFSIDPATGALLEKSTDAKELRGIAQSPVDPAIFYANHTFGGASHVSQFRFNSTTFKLDPVKDLATAFAGRLVPLSIAGKEFLYGAANDKVRVFDTVTNNQTVQFVVTGTVIDIAGARPDGNTPVLQVLLEPSVGAANGVLRTYPLTLGGQIDAPNSRQINVNAGPRSLHVHANAKAYTGSFTVSSLSGVQLNVPPAQPTMLTNQPYSTNGTPNAMTSIGNLFFSVTSPEAMLEAFTVAADGSLTKVGTLDVGGSLNDVEAIILP